MRGRSGTLLHCATVFLGIAAAVVNGCDGAEGSGTRPPTATGRQGDILGEPGSPDAKVVLPGGTGVLKVDGKAVDEVKMEHTIPIILQFDESLDVGSDTLTGVDDRDYRPPFAFGGRIQKITLTVDRPKLSEEDKKTLKEAAEKAGMRK